jgi:hypothetical protein
MRTPEEIEEKLVNRRWPWSDLGRLTGAGGREVIAQTVKYDIYRIMDHKEPWYALGMLEMWAWLQGDDEWAAYLADEATYPMYGAPRLRDACRRLGIEWPADQDMTNMADGKECSEWCERGCIKWVHPKELQTALDRIADLEAQLKEV